MIRFDCHAHVYERIVPAGRPRYVPTEPAPLADWLARQAGAGLCGGVIVQVSFLGADNSQMVQALARLDRRRFAGIAVTDPGISDAGLVALAEAGVRGVRWNLVAGAAIPDPAAPATRRFADRLRAHDMHIEMQLESARLAPVLAPLAGLGLPVVVDHLGLPSAPDAAAEPWLDALEGLRDRGNIFTKLSAPYRGIPDPRRHIDRAMALLPGDQLVWGSDWPHTRHETEATYAGLLPDLAGRMDDAGAVARLYGLSATDPVAVP